MGLAEFWIGFSGTSRLDAGDFHFDAPVLGMVVFADAVRDVDEGALSESESGSSLGEVPADGSNG